VFLLEGRVVKLEVLGPNEDICEEILVSGAWFGERCFFGSDMIREFTVIADSQSELAILPLFEYMRVVQLFPRLWKQHNRLQKECRRGKLHLEELAYIRPSDHARRASGLVLTK
ncbi:unnamed protein product, partial [Polarella glacialis]